MLLNRRHVQLGLGSLWLVDAALQLQPYMFSRSFPQQVIAGAADGQPGWVSAGVLWAAHLMASAPALTNAVSALVQLMIAAAILWRRMARFGLIVSILWAISVWYFGEGLGGIASGHATLITGAPGAALLYAVLALFAWPRGGSLRHAGNPEVAVSRLVLPAWTAFWVGGALLQLLPGQNSGRSIADSVNGSAADAPGWFTGADGAVGRFITAAGVSMFVAVLVVVLLIGTLALARQAVACWAVAAGVALAAAFWVFGQSLGAINTGMSTDPNAGPLVALFAAALLSAKSGDKPGRRTQSLKPVTLISHPTAPFAV